MGEGVHSEELGLEVWMMSSLSHDLRYDCDNHSTDICCEVSVYQWDL